jgi:Lipocalin-like domain
MIDRVRLIGNWALVKHGRVDNLGNYHPTAEQMNGQLIYAADASMSVLITKTPEPVLVTDIIAYSGSFSVAGGKVLHHIKVSPYPRRLNTTEIRLPSFRGDDLVLSTEPDQGGRYEIVWRK